MIRKYRKRRRHCRLFHHPALLLSVLFLAERIHTAGSFLHLGVNHYHPGSPQRQQQQQQKQSWTRRVDIIHGQSLASCEQRWQQQHARLFSFSSNNNNNAQPPPTPPHKIKDNQNNNRLPPPPPPQQQPERERPTPNMPSRLFQDLAQSQLELLAGALTISSSLSSSSTSSTTTAANSGGNNNNSKVKSMALYLPQENAKTGQLEFVPVVLYPPPSRDRVFIASGADSGVAPTIPRTLTTLPGFSHARSLLPGYPMVHQGDEDYDDGGGGRIGAVEEVLCAVDGTGAGALSVPLFFGSQTAGVLLVYPSIAPPRRNTNKKNKENHTDDDAADDDESSSSSVWTHADRNQVARAARTLSLALSMDAERAASEERQQVFAEALSDRMHQVKNPLQALRTYGKLLQQRLADADVVDVGNIQGTRQLLNHLLIQEDRLTAQLRPVDAMIDKYTETSRQFALVPTRTSLNNNSQTTTTTTSPPPRWTTPLLPYRNIESVAISAIPEAAAINPPVSTTSVSNGLPLTVPERKTASISSVMGDSLDCEMTFMADVLEPIFESFRAIAMDRSIRFEEDLTPDLPGVMANAEALQEAVTNVLDNAFKYVQFGKPAVDNGAITAPTATVSTNPSPKVRVRVFPNAAPDGSGVTILVEDNGPGIPMGAEESIFERGYRDASTKTVGGSGIGLPIARALIEKMGGTLQVVNSNSTRNSKDRALNGAQLQFQLFRSPKRL